MTQRDMALEMARIGEAMQQAMADAKDGEIAYLNTAGPVGQAVIEVIEHAIDPEALVGFVSEDRYGHAEGDCLFTATYAMTALYHAKTIAPFRLCTGYFDHPDMAPERVVHAWLETSLRMEHPIVLNVSNPRSKPVYAMYRSNYFWVNHMKKRVQTVSASDFARAIRAYRTKHGETVDIVEFSKVLLKKARSALHRELKAAVRRKNSKGVE